MLYIIVAILMFGVLIAIHEFGHFTAAKLLGVQVNEYAIGMGPLLWHKQWGETQYSLRAFPIGGYCAMEGEDEDSENPRAFSAQKAWKRLIILVAGSFMNFLIGFVIILALFSTSTAFSSPEISGFMDGFPLQGEQGLMAGDTIVSINGAHVHTYQDVNLILTRLDDESMDLVIRRGGEELVLEDFPLTRQEYENDGTMVLKYGLLFGSVEATPLVKLQYSWFNCLYFVRLVWYGLVDLVSGVAGLADLSGPIGIVDTISEVGSQSDTIGAGLQNVFYYIALIAVNLAVMNMLPLPALDGGRIFFLLLNSAFTLVTRRKINPKYEGYVHAAGLFCLLALMVVVAFNDIVRIVG